MNALLLVVLLGVTGQPSGYATGQMSPTSDVSQNHVRSTSGTTKALKDWAESITSTSNGLLPFTATGSTTARTPADRAADVLNVKNFGAKCDSDETGTTGTDDTAAFQAAVTYGQSLLGGRYALYVPKGACRVTSTISFNATTFRIFGDGLVSRIVGTVPGGYVLSKSDSTIVSKPSIENLYVMNKSSTSGSGGVQMVGSIGGRISNLRVETQAANGIGVAAWDTNFTLVVEGVVAAGTGNVGIGILAGNHTQVINPDVVGWSEGIRAFGLSVSIVGGRIEVNTTGIQLGTDNTGADSSFTGGRLEAISMEANDTGLYVRHVSGARVGPVRMQGSVNAPSGQSVYGIRVGTVADSQLFGWEIGGTYSTAAVSLEVAGTGTLSGISASNSLGPAWVNTASSLSGFVFTQTNFPNAPMVGASTFDALDPGSVVSVGGAVAGEVDIGTSGTNLLLQSQAFNTSPWVPTGSGVAAPTVTNNTSDVASVDGTFTASKMVIPAVSSGSNGSYDRQTVTVSAATYTFSVWVRTLSGTCTEYLSSTPDGATYIRQSFTATSTWTRVSVSGATTATNWFWLIGTDLRDGSQSATTGCTLYVARGQLEKASSAGPYVATTTVSVVPATKVLSPLTAQKGVTVGSSAGGALHPSTDAGAAQGGALYQNSGVPSNGNGSNGDVYFRTDTPGVPGQQAYQRAGGAWSAMWDASSVGTVALNAASPAVATATVRSGALCVCTNQTTQANPVKCAVATTTLTATGPNGATDVVTYACF